MTDFMRNVSKNIFLKNLKLFLSGKSLLAITTLIIGVITARLLTPENRGLYTLFFTISGLLVTIFHIGISPANIYFTNIKKININILMGNTLIYLFLSSFLIGLFLILLVLFDFTGPFVTSQPWVIWFMLWVTFCYTLTEVCITGLILAYNKYKFLNKSLVFQSVALLISCLLIYVVEFDLEKSLGLRVSFLLFFTFWFVITFIKLSLIIKFSFSFDILIKQLKFGSKNWLQNLIGFLNVRSYILLLGILSSPTVVALFSVAWIFVEVLRFIPDAVATMILPELTNNKSKDQQILLTIKTLKIIFYLVLLLSLFFYLISDYFIPFIFGSAYQESVNISKFLMLGAAFGVIYQVLTRYYTSQARQIYSIIAGLCGLVVGLICSFIFIPISGGEGAAAAFLISSVTTALFGIYFFCKTTLTPIMKLIKITKEDFLIT